MNNRMKELRARESLSQQELARLVGVRRETIVFLEKGKYNPSLRLAHDIASHFHLPIEQVFVFDDEADGKQS
jgi:putative transcriptional regulator